MNEYNFEQVEKLRIHELRDYARSVGVSSPTTMNKNALLRRIAEIFESKNIGLTPKTSNDEVDFFELLKSNDISILNKLLDREARSDKREKRYKSETEKGLNLGNEFSFGVAQNEANYSSTSGEDFEGYLDVHPEGYGIVRKNGYMPGSDDVYITEALLTKKGLKKGDFIKGKAKVIIASRPKIMYEVTYIDSVAFETNGEFDKYPYLPLGEKLYLEKNKITLKKGERTYIPSMELSKVMSLASELADENSCSTKIVNFGAVPECAYKSTSKIEVVNIPFNKDEVECLNTIELIVERIKREAEMGKPSVLFLYGFSDILRAFNVAMEGYYGCKRVNAKAIHKMKDILYIAKNAGENIYVNIVCVDKNGVSSDLEEVVNLELLPLLDKRV